MRTLYWSSKRPLEDQYERTEEKNSVNTKNTDHIYRVNTMNTDHIYHKCTKYVQYIIMYFYQRLTTHVTHCVPVVQQRLCVGEARMWSCFTAWRERERGLGAHVLCMRTSHRWSAGSARRLEWRMRRDRFYNPAHDKGRLCALHQRCASLKHTEHLSLSEALARCPPLSDTVKTAVWLALVCQTGPDTYYQTFIKHIKHIKTWCCSMWGTYRLA